MAFSDGPPGSSGSTPGHAVDSQVFLKQAEDLLSQGRLQESESAFKKVINLSVDAAQGFYGLGVIQFRRGDYDSAATLFQRSVQLDHRNANAYFYLGETWGKKDAREVALGFYRKACEIDPRHRGALQRIQTLTASSRPVNQNPVEPEMTSSRISPAVSEVQGAHGSPGAPQSSLASSGVYDFIRQDTSNVARQALTLIDSLTMTSVTPRLSAYAGPMLTRAGLAILVCILTAVLFNKLLAANPLVQAKTSGLQHTKPYTQPEKSLPQHFPTAGGFPKATHPTSPYIPRPTTTARYSPLLFPLILLELVIFAVSALAIALKAKTTHYTFNKARLEIESGIFSKRHENVELYRIDDIFLNQTWVNRLTNDGTLQLNVTPSHGTKTQYNITGLAKIYRLKEIFEQLRELVFLMRTGAWGKGVIY